MLSFRIQFFLCLFGILVAEKTAADAEGTTADEQTEEEGGYFSTLDYILLTAVAAAAGYYFLFKGSDDQMPEYEIKTLSVRQESVVDKGFIAKMRKTNRRLVVFYGSQTGTAEEFAGRLAKEGARYGLKGLVADPEEGIWTTSVSSRTWRRRSGGPAWPSS